MDVHASQGRHVTADLLFALVLSLLLSHELDAMVRHEWRLLPGLSSIGDDALARDTFNLLHVPLLSLVAYFATHPERRVRARLQTSVAAFAALHAIVHAIVSHVPTYEFVPPVETITVYGSGVGGALFLLLTIARRGRLASEA